MTSGPWKSGDMRQPVTVQRVTYTDDGSGGQNKTWADFCKIYCHTEDRSAGEESGDKFPGQVRSVETRTFITWWRSDLTVEDRLSWNGELWNIRDADNYQARNKFLVLTAERGVEQ